MKKFSKFMLTVAAASVMTAAMAVTAMAADTITGTYDNDTGVVTMDGVIGSGASQTLLVLNNVEEFGSASDIAYINQIDNNGTFATFVLEAGLRSDTPSTYNIKIGGTDGSVQTGTLTIEATTPTVTTVTIKIGDVTNDNNINMADVTQIGRIAKGRTRTMGNAGDIKNTPDGGTIKIGDVTNDNNINMADVTQVGRIAKGRTRTMGNAGDMVEVLAEN